MRTGFEKLRQRLTASLLSVGPLCDRRLTETLEQEVGALLLQLKSGKEQITPKPGWRRPETSPRCTRSEATLPSLLR